MDSHPIDDSQRVIQMWLSQVCILFCVLPFVCVYVITFCAVVFGVPPRYLCGVWEAVSKVEESHWNEVIPELKVADKAVFDAIMADGKKQFHMLAQRCLPRYLKAKAGARPDRNAFA